MRLLAGPVTVYDGGVYAGDALMNFLSKNEKRIISWGKTSRLPRANGQCLPLRSSYLTGLEL